jgi:orotate phosphoribosyltransferase-like protein
MIEFFDYYDQSIIRYETDQTRDFYPIEKYAVRENGERVENTKNYDEVESKNFGSVKKYSIVITERIGAYGSTAEQIEFITENGLEAWQAKVAKIKNQYPKE